MRQHVIWSGATGVSSNQAESDEGNMPKLITLFLSCATLLVMAGAPLRAADDEYGGSFLNPFPQGEVYQVIVLGDGFAQGLLAGLQENFANDTRLNIDKIVRPIEGIMSSGFDKKIESLQGSFDKERADIVVVMLGESDRVQLKSSSGRRVAIMSPEWRAEYGRRLDRVIGAIKGKSTGVYWVGLPILSRSDANQQAQGMNEVIRERAYQNGMRYIDVFAGFQDENGNYSPYGPDLDGKVRVLRGPDGVSFTGAGNQKLAHFLEKEMRRDLNQAKSERAAPLAGGEAEQAKINPDNAVNVVAPSSPAAGEKTAAEPDKKPLVSVPADSDADQKADHAKITLKVIGAEGREEEQSVEILRPTIPASVVSLMARRSGSGQMGDLLVDQIAGGLTLMNSVTPSGQKGVGKLSPSQAPYFRLLVKGERLQSKPGRADDLDWFKPESSSNAVRGRGLPRG